MGTNHGTFAGTGCVSYAPGVAGRAFVFDGIHRDRFDVGNPTNLQLQNFTIEAWIRRSNPTNISLDDLGDDGSRSGEGGQVFGYGYNGYALSMANDGKIILSRVGNDGVLSARTVSDTNWHHVAVVREETAVALYLDGAPASPRQKLDTPFYFEHSASIGSLGGGFGGTFWGAIDEVAVYRWPLSAAAIREIYRAGAAAQYLPQYRPFVPPLSGLVEWWQANGDVRTVGGETNATLVNGATFAAGRIGRAFKFNGRDQYVKIPKTPKFDVGDQVSIVLWVKADLDNDMRRLQGLVSTDFYSISLCTGYKFSRPGIVFYLNTDGQKTALDDEEAYPNTADANGGGAVVTAGEWHHIAGTYDGARIQLYIDGVPWGKPMLHTGAIAPMLPNSFLSIGSEDGRGIPGSKGRGFKGLIDEVAIYKRTLTTNEIDYLYHAGCAGMSFAGRPAR
jgi:concanavalin A-like lectin/glucanase superfamily protein